MNPIIMYMVGIERQKDFLRGAEQRRLVRRMTAGQPGMITRSVERLGGFLIKIGEQLQKQHAPQSTGVLGWVEK